MLSVQQAFKELIASLRNVIAPAIAEPYPKSQAYMAAVILEFLARQVDERTDLVTAKERSLMALFADLAKLPGPLMAAEGDKGDNESRLIRLIEAIYAHREELGEEAFAATQTRVRRTLRELLDQDLKVAGKAEA